MSLSLEDRFNADLSMRVTAVKYIPYDESKIASMSLKETLVTLQLMHRDEWVTSRKIEWRYNQAVRLALKQNFDALTGRDGTKYPEPEDFKETLYKPKSKGGFCHYGEWYNDTQRVIPLLMKHLFALERELSAIT